MTTQIKRRLALDSDQAGNLKGHIYTTTAGLVILEKLTDAALTQALDWKQLAIILLILFALAVVSYCDMGSAKHFPPLENDPSPDDFDDFDDFDGNGGNGGNTLQEVLRRHM